MSSLRVQDCRILVCRYDNVNQNDFKWRKTNGRVSGKVQPLSGESRKFRGPSESGDVFMVSRCIIAAERKRTWNIPHANCLAILLISFLAPQSNSFASEDRCLPSLDKPLKTGLSTTNYLPDELLPLDRYVKEVGERLVASIDVDQQEFSFHLIDDHTVNAVADRCGNIWISRGMLMHLNSESELAFVLGHEIGHVLLKHGQRRDLRRGIRSAVSSVLAGLTSATGFGRYERKKSFDEVGVLVESGKFQEEELQADEAAADYMSKAGFDVNGALNATELLKNQEYFEFKRARLEEREPRVNKQFVASHPDNDERYERTRDKIKGFPRGTETKQDRNAFVAKLEGISFGPKGLSGIQRGRSFYYPRLGIKLSLPVGWTRRVEAGERRVLTFSSSKNDATFTLKTAGLKARVPLEDIVQQMGFQIREGKALTIGGMPAYLGIADRVDTPFGTRPSRLVLLADQRKGILYVGLGAGQFDLKRIAADGDFIKIIFSMERMARDDFQDAKPLKVQVVRAESGTTFESLAAASDLPNYALDQLRVINGLYPKGQPEPGQLIKIID